MSYVLTRATWACGPDDPLLRLVLLGLAKHADRNGLAVVALSHLTAEVGSDRDMTICTLDALRAEGWFTRPRQMTYQLSLRKLRVYPPEITPVPKSEPWTCQACGALHRRQTQKEQI